MWALTEDGADFESTLKMNYIELAALGMVHLPVSGERVSAHLLAGPALALEASCGWTSQATFMGTDLELGEDCDDGDVLDRSNFDLGLAGGGESRSACPTRWACRSASSTPSDSSTWTRTRATR